MANAPLIRTMQIAAVIFAFGFVASGQTPAAEQGTPVIQLVAATAAPALSHLASASRW